MTTHHLTFDPTTKTYSYSYRSRPGDNAKRVVGASSAPLAHVIGLHVDVLRQHHRNAHRDFAVAMIGRLPTYDELREGGQPWWRFCETRMGEDGLDVRIDYEGNIIPREQTRASIFGSGARF